jgi:UDP-2,4-diacetamido-2,4,6-trideoxy-beta-L-altropyranose hydrolase
MSDTKAQDIRLRPADLDDCRRIWEWRNEATTREASFDTNPVPYLNHHAWFSQKMKDPNTNIFIVENAVGNRIGYVRFDVEGAEAEISVSLDRNERGKGYGTTAIRRGAEEMISTGSAERIIALVKAGNLASMSAFQRAGFVVQATRQTSGADSHTLVYDGVQPS